MSGVHICDRVKRIEQRCQFSAARLVTFWFFILFWVGMNRYEQMKRERQQSTQGRNLYIKHINPELGDDELKLLFEKFGSITSVKVGRLVCWSVDV